MRTIKPVTGLCLSALLLLLGACQTMQTRVVESVKDEGLQELDRWEERLVQLRLRPDAAALEALRRDLKARSERGGLDRPIEARVLGLYGEAEWLAGEEGNVRRLVRLIEGTHRGEARLYVLRAFLARESEKPQVLEEGLKTADRPDLIRLHLGDLYLGQGRYAAAAAAFDEAFAGLPRGYRDLYGEKRDLAFRLKERGAPAAGGSLRALESPELTVETMVQLTRQETPFLDHLVERGPVPTERVLVQLARADYLPASAGGARAAVRRGEAARFVHRIVVYLENDPGLLRRYSELYGARGESPVPDVPVQAPWFDAVLGLVERGLFDLPDGVHFFPERPVSGMDFYLVLTSLKTRYR
jgi:tetratricopeptide (TPR) repeat protein